ncbi:MAG: phage holin family protein [Alphaproteobacteria bacterium]|nr:phage holin family protein [Alphaproteobacteria bacterium]
MTTPDDPRDPPDPTAPPGDTGPREAARPAEPPPPSEPPPPADPPPPGGGDGGGDGKRKRPGEGVEDKARVLIEPYLKIMRRALRSIRGFFAAHVIVVRTEAEQEFVRLMGGFVLLFGTAILMLTSAILAGAASVALVQRLSGLPWLESISIAMAGTLTAAFLLLTVAWVRLRKPLMPKSRELFEKTLDGLSDR